MESPEPVAYVNGQFYPKSQAKISIYDHGFLFGDGVFDTMVAVNGFLFKLDQHVDRFYRSARAVKINIPMEKSKLKSLILETVRRSGLRDAYAKCIVTRGEGPRPLLDPSDLANPSLVIFAVPPVSTIRPEKLQAGARVITLPIQRPSHESLDPRIKSLNYLPVIMMRFIAREGGFDEAICLSQDGHVAEAPGENVFIISDGVVMTPAREILEGITRETVIEIARSEGYMVQEKDLTLYDLYNADEAFFSSSAGGVMPIKEIDTVSIGTGKPGEVTMKIKELYFKMLQDGVDGTPIF